MHERLVGLSILATALLFGLVATASPAPAQAQRGVPLVGRHQGTWTLVDVAPPFAYATGGGSLVVLDVRDPAQPREIGRSAPVLYWPRALAVADGIAYVADADRGLRRFDVRLPSAPRELAPWQPGRIDLVATDGRHVYAIVVGQEDGGSRDQRLHVLHARGVAPLRPRGSIEVPRAYAMAAEAGQVVVTSGTRLLLVDASTPDAPKLRVDMAIPVAVGESTAMWLRDGRLVLAGETEVQPQRYWPSLMELRVGPGRLDVVSGATLRDPPYDRHPKPSLVGVAVVGDRAIALRRDDGKGSDTYAYDLVEATLGTDEMRWLPASRALPPDAHDLTAVAETLLVAAGEGGLMALDLGADTQEPRTLVDGAGAAARAVAVGERLWVADRYNHLHVADPAGEDGALDRVQLVNRVDDVAANGTYAVVLDQFPRSGHNPRLTVFEAGAEEPIAHVPLSRGPSFVRLQGNLALIGGGGSLLQIVSLDSPVGPLRLAGSIEVEDVPPTSGDVSALAAAGSHVGLAVDGVADRSPYLLIASIADPRRPELVSTLELPAFVHAMASDGRHLFLAGRTEGVRVIDIADPRQPRVIATLAEPSRAAGAVVHEGVLYVAAGYGGSGGLWAYDVRDPRRPRLIARSALPDAPASSGPLRGMAARGDRIFVAAEQAGVLRFAAIEPGRRPIELYLPRLLLEAAP